MKQSRELAKKNWRGSGDSTVDDLWFDIKDKISVTEFLGNLGIKPEAIKSSPLKAQPNPLEPFSEEARKATRMIISDIHAMFIDLVAERRKMERSEAKKLSDGRIYTGRQAVANGLIDALGGDEEARHWLDTSKGI